MTYKSWTSLFYVIYIDRTFTPTLARQFDQANPHWAVTQNHLITFDFLDRHKCFNRAPSILQQMAECKLNRTCELNPSIKINYVGLKLFEMMRKDIEKKRLHQKHHRVFSI